MSGNFLIRIIVFTILVIVNFVVITKGSGRMAEVAARFHTPCRESKWRSTADLSVGLSLSDPSIQVAGRPKVGEVVSIAGQRHLLARRIRTYDGE